MTNYEIAGGEYMRGNRYTSQKLGEIEYWQNILSCFRLWLVFTNGKILADTYSWRCVRNRESRMKDQGGAAVGGIQVNTEAIGLDDL